MITENRLHPNKKGDIHDVENVKEYLSKFSLLFVQKQR
ncbi:hypothetical protein B4110_1338 [Parageobacillus toebii]|uniref:Uncharacterized protein n=1 Tax=Parageobacillus toebii TaxID=153151 RepID=A0A150MZ76_9BACL|nr:hypothetical protein B4110_1338 [Parageobacillus toebii]